MSQPDKHVAEMLRVKTHPVLPKPLAQVTQKGFICFGTWNWMETRNVIIITTITSQVTYVTNVP